MVRVSVALYRVQLLRPVGTGIAQISPSVVGATKRFVRITNISWKSTGHRDCLEYEQKNNRIYPAAAALHQNGRRARDYDRKKNVNRQDVANTDIHSALHRSSHVEQRRDQQEEKFTRLL